MRNNATPRERAQSAVPQQKSTENEVHLISFQEEGGWMNTDTPPPTSHLLTPSSIPGKVTLQWCPEAEFSFQQGQEAVVLKCCWHENCAVKAHLCAVLCPRISMQYALPALLQDPTVNSSGRIYWRGQSTTPVGLP